MLFYTITATILSFILAVVSFWLPTLTPDTEKLSPYECGFDPLGSARLPYSMRFFLVAILFLLFDLEIALILPTPWSAHLATPSMTVLWIAILVSIFTLGFVHEWFQGGLEWAE
uniref:NADH-ubiquinone oxidoreductase chain 3 n=1 Tax=Cardioglossa leucomystax TaxID=111122 RepID=S4V217_9NEOB|nr:NADH dehydrogenase subunit 3 [Cardioglossa leucomystax]